LLLTLSFSKAHAQTIFDSTGKKIDSATKGTAAIDTAINDYPSPHKASVRSAIIPGWGQIYNKSYWKLPIVYGALGTTAYVFFFNLNAYKELRFAYSARYKASLPPKDPASSYPGPYQDSTDYYLLKPLYQNPDLDLNSLKFNRDEYRRYVDYSVLIFALIWALNVADAAVDAHLKSFDVSPDLGLRFKAGYSDIARTNGFSVIVTFR
jgi:hypothetical protein